MSARELAQRAGVSPSTIGRIERGLMDPTLGTIQKLMAATGCELEMRSRRARATTTPPRLAPPLALSDLHDAWRGSSEGARPDWTRIRAFLDALAMHPELVESAICQPPRRSRSPMMNALLAGIADKLADDHGLRRPAWTRRAGRLKRRWYTPGTPSMRRTARERAPSQLMARNLAIREDSLWRPHSRATV